jgi:hypothetical protein
LSQHDWFAFFVLLTSFLQLNLSVAFPMLPIAEPIKFEKASVCHLNFSAEVLFSEGWLEKFVEFRDII